MTIPIAAQATSSHILYVIRNTLLKVLVIDETHLDYILQLLIGKATTVEYIIVISSSRSTDEKEINYKEKSVYFGVHISSLYGLQKIGLENPIQPEKRSNNICKSILNGERKYLPI